MLGSCDNKALSAWRIVPHDVASPAAPRIRHACTRKVQVTMLYLYVSLYL